MATFSLLQNSLDQKIDRQSFEDASVVASSVARADCHRLYRELYGVVTSKLPRHEADALQAELARRGFPTRVVPDAHLPPLPDAFRARRLVIESESISFTDALGHIQTRSRAELVFAAGGFLMNQRMTHQDDIRWDVRPAGRATIKTLKPVRTMKLASFPELRADFFFWKSPQRLQLALTADCTIFYQGHHLRLRDTEALLALLSDIRRLLPPERINTGLEHAASAAAYPSLTAYHEEIRWHFFHLIPK
ncbi:MAG: hypothetical protein WED15_06905 [Akkermansiaceae bacterium]